MTSGYVYCSNCGTAATPGQQFCASCGTTLPAAAAAAAPVPVPAQPAWTAPPPPTPPVPVYGEPQVPPYGQVPYGQVPYGMQMAPPPRNNMLVPVVLIVGLLVVVALLGVGVLIATSGSKGTSTSTSTSSGGHVVATATQGQNATPTKGTTKTPTPEPGGGNSVVITPDTVSCSGASVTLHIVMTLDGSLPSSMAIKPFIDSTVGTQTTIGAVFTKQSGSWRESETVSSSSWCSTFGVGAHTVGIQDGDGQVIVEGTITFTD